MKSVRMDFPDSQLSGTAMSIVHEALFVNPENRNNGLAYQSYD